MSAIDDLSSGPFYHGTKADLNEGSWVGFRLFVQSAAGQP